MLISPAILNSYVGRNIDEICSVKFKADNHCAHFVSHVMQLHFGYQCGAGANVRVHEVFARCPWVRPIVTCPPQDTDCLIFVTNPHNVTTGHQGQTVSGAMMENVPKKHIGILIGSMVWHYSNSAQHVRCETVDQFLYHYPNQANGLWTGGFPAGASGKAFGT